MSLMEKDTYILHLSMTKDIPIFIPDIYSNVVNFLAVQFSRSCIILTSAYCKSSVAFSYL